MTGDDVSLSCDVTLLVTEIEVAGAEEGDWVDQHTPCLLRPSSVIDSAWYEERDRGEGRRDRVD